MLIIAWFYLKWPYGHFVLSLYSHIFYRQMPLNIIQILPHHSIHIRDQYESRNFCFQTKKGFELLGTTFVKRLPILNSYSTPFTVIGRILASFVFDVLIIAWFWCDSQTRH